MNYEMKGWGKKSLTSVSGYYHCNLRGVSEKKTPVKGTIFEFSRP
jgi:hypothetical protein